MSTNTRITEDRNRRNSRGFVSIFLVTIIGLLAGLFIAESSTRAAMQAGNIEKQELLAELKLNAISCIHIARLKVFVSPSSVATLEGKYDLPQGSCEIVESRVSGGKIHLEIGSEEGDLGVTLVAEIDRESLDIVNLREEI